MVTTAGFGVEARTCACGATFTVPTILRHVVRCGACSEAQEAAALAAFRAGVEARLSVLVHRLASGVGLDAAELEADVARVPVALKKALPTAPARAFVAGEPVREGAALVGGSGIGKTSALAAMTKTRIEAQVRSRLAALTTVPLPGEGDAWAGRPDVAWVNWPAEARRLREAVVAGRGGRSGPPAAGAGYVRAPILVLDDVGRERLSKGGYDEDVAFEALDALVDARLRARLPVWWTSNLTPQGLASRYGAAFFSRLCGLAPVAEAPALPDLRLSGKP